jgi:hypothetical protein
MKNYDIKLLKLLNLDLYSKYSKKYIFDKLISYKLITKNIIDFKTNKIIYLINYELLNVLIEFCLINTNESFYKLFYLKVGKWRNGLKNGFGRNYIYKIIASLSTNNFEANLNFYDEGEKNLNQVIEI